MNTFSWGFYIDFSSGVQKVVKHWARFYKENFDIWWTWFIEVWFYQIIETITKVSRWELSKTNLQLSELIEIFSKVLSYLSSLVWDSPSCTLFFSMIFLDDNEPLNIRFRFRFKNTLFVPIMVMIIAIKDRTYNYLNIINNRNHIKHNLCTNVLMINFKIMKKRYIR